MKNTILGLGILIIIGVGVWASRVNVSESMHTPYKVGVVLGLTGPASTWSEYAKKAADLAAKQINDAGGVNGRSIELVYEDSKTTPAGAVSAFQKLTDSDHVSVVVGDVWSFITNPLIPLATTKKVVVVSPTVMDKSVEGSSPYFFTLGHTVDGQEAAVGKFFDLNPDIKTAVIGCWNDAWGKAHSDLFRKVASEKHVTVVGEECTADYSDDYRTFISKVKAKNPDALLLTTSNPDVVFKAINELRLTAKVLTTNVVVDAVVVRHVSPVLFSRTWFLNWEPNKEFVDAFESTYGSYPIMESQNSYEAVRAVAKALEKNDSNVLKGLESVRYESVDGEVDFTGDHVTVNKAQAKLYTVDAKGKFSEAK